MYEEVPLDISWGDEPYFGSEFYAEHQRRWQKLIILRFLFVDIAVLISS